MHQAQLQSLGESFQNFSLQNWNSLTVFLPLWRTNSRLYNPNQISWQQVWCPRKFLWLEIDIRSAYWLSLQKHWQVFSDWNLRSPIKGATSPTSQINAGKFKYTKRRSDASWTNATDVGTSEHSLFSINISGKKQFFRKLVFGRIYILCQLLTWRKGVICLWKSDFYLQRQKAKTAFISLNSQYMIQPMESVLVSLFQHSQTITLFYMIASEQSYNTSVNSIFAKLKISLPHNEIEMLKHLHNKAYPLSRKKTT